MKNKYIIKRCSNCGATVRIIKDCTCDNCGITCCGEEMKVLKPNNKNYSEEKHMPSYEIKNGKLKITVNHEMVKGHYIEWISIIDNDTEITTHFKPGEEVNIECIYKKGIILCAYCNKHGLWMKEVK